jgi:hypothetical protein
MHMRALLLALAAALSEGGVIWSPSTFLGSQVPKVASNMLGHVNLGCSPTADVLTGQSINTTAKACLYLDGTGLQHSIGRGKLKTGQRGGLTVDSVGQWLARCTGVWPVVT